MSQSMTERSTATQRSLNGEDAYPASPTGGVAVIPLEQERTTALRKAAGVTLLGLAVTAGAVGSLAYWLTSDWFHDPGPYPDSWAGFTYKTFWALAFANTFTAMGYVLLYIGITTGSRLTEGSSSFAAEAVWLGLQGTLGLASMVAGIFAVVIWGGNSFMNCLGLFCVGTSKYTEVTIPHTIRDSAGQGWMGVVGCMIFFTLTPIGIVLIWRTVRRALLPRFGDADQNEHPAPTDVDRIQKARSTARVLTFVAYGGSVVAVILFAVASFFIPNDWEYFTGARIAAAARLQVVDPSLSAIEMYNVCQDTYGTPNPVTCPELPWAYFASRQIKVNENLYLKLFPSNVFFYCYLFGILTAAFIVTHVNRDWAHFWSRPMPPLPKFVPAYMRARFTRGEFAGMWITKWLFIVSFIYWVHDHNFDGNWDPTNTGDTIGNTNSVRWARSCGQIAVVALSLLMFAGSRQSIMHKLLGTTWEAFIWAHKVLGYVMLLATLMHIFFWWKEYSNDGIFPAEIFQLPPQNPEGIDNFTIPLIFIATMILLLCMGVLALDPIRRRFFEVFYYSHQFAVWGILPVTLWHAAAGWEYMLPGCTVWLIDRLLRASRSAARARIISAKTTQQDDDDQVNRHAEPALSTEIKFVVDSDALMSALPGQYVFLNVPEISIFEWHPFTLSHCPMADETRANEGNYLSVHVKAMGEGTWTRRLYDFITVRTDSQGNIDGGAITIAVDGPCGAPFDWQDYSDVVLVGGGIGVTPVACIFDALKRTREAFKAETTESSLIGDRKLRAIWALREEPLLNTDLRMQFGGIAEERDHDPDMLTTKPAFPDNQASIFLTRRCDLNVLSTYGDAGLYGKGITPPAFDCGRPNVGELLASELLDTEQESQPLKPGRRPIVFVCGPEPLVVPTQEWCDAHGVAFHRETFLL